MEMAGNATELAHDLSIGKRLKAGGGSATIAYLAGFMSSLALLLVGLMDIRRGFLAGDYLIQNTWINYNHYQLPLLAAGLVGLLLCYRLIKERETRGTIEEERNRALAKVTAFGIFAILTATTVFIYRGVAMARILAAGKMSIPALGLSPAQLPGTKELMPLATTPNLLKPLAVALNYLSLVWGATILGLLLAGFAATVIPLYCGRLFSAQGSGKLRPLLGGMVYGIPHPFCSCCAAPISATIYRTSRSVAAAVAFLLTSPTLNVTSLILAAALLPTLYALLRIIGGGIFVVAAAYLAACLADRAPREDNHRPPTRFFVLLSKVFNPYCNLFHFETPATSNPTPAGIIATWASNSWRAAKVAIPSLLVGAVLAGVAAVFLPATFTNTPAGVALASLLGTLFMIATWTEIPVAGVLAAQGLTGPAAALLVTLPAVSLPCLLVFGGALRSARIAAALGLATFIFGVAAGLLFR